MTSQEWESRVTPAQLSFLSVYNPSLGPTDDTFRDQVVFYYSRLAKESRAASKSRKKDSARQLDLKEEENEKLRQIGLAQGMVNFARSFSDGKAVETVDTEKSRIVLHELEKGWWILASIDLTRLPAAATSSSSTDKFEYSSREVSPSELLLQQLLRANRIFLLHHGPSLGNLYAKLGRDKFCSLLDRYWTRFGRDWEVLLHGNPAVDVFGGVKLSSGGELGIGVGEEEWGSGERNVLEDLTRHTEGLIDLTVSRFGEVKEDVMPGLDFQENDESHNTPWLGSGHLPEAEDGIIFGGLGAMSRPCLRDIAAWVQTIYTYGDRAYGVRDNPQRQRRKKRKLNPGGDADGWRQALSQEVTSGGDLREQTQKAEALRADASSHNEVQNSLPHDLRPQGHGRIASHDHATRTDGPQVASSPGVPPPIVHAAEASLNKAILDAGRKSEAEVTESTSTYGISGKWMRYLTFGLSGGTPSPAGTASALGPASPVKTRTSRPLKPRRTSTSSSTTVRPGKYAENSFVKPLEEELDMQNVDPVPEGEAEAAMLATQQRFENQGCFLIGLKGDLHRRPSKQEGDDEADDAGFESDDEGSRLTLRTLQIERNYDKSYFDQVEADANDGSPSSQDPRYQRLRVVVYLRRPFIYTFLFEQRASALQMSSFYQGLHQHLLPLHRPLLSSTSVAKVAERIAQSHAPPVDDPETIARSAEPMSSPVFDLVYDPLRLTVHTTIPNIPLPGTLLAEGIGGKNTMPLWTRIEALNVHSQILNTLASTRDSRREIERTSKTSRGWWVVWMRLPSGASSSDDVDSRSQDGLRQARETQDGIEDCRVAFLVRRASDWIQAQKSYGSRVGSGMFGLGKSSEDGAGGAATGWGPSALAGGIGIDARRYVEGLLSLNR